MDASTATQANSSPALATADGTSRNVGRIEEIQGVVIEAVFSAGMLRLRKRSAAKTVAPLRITTITRGVSMSL